MTTDVSVTFDDLESAFYWVSADGTLGNNAFISRTSGTIYYSSADGFVDEEVPEDVDDPGQYWSVPHKNDLGLGRSLVLRFVSEALPEDYNSVRSFFERRGAYSKFKELLQRRGQLERWFAYETQAIEQALTQWAAECGFRVVRSADSRAGV